MSETLKNIKNVVRRIPGAQVSYRTGKHLVNLGVREKKVAMFHFGRCGSTVVGEMLNSHSNIFWASEIFRFRNKAKIEKFGRNYFRNEIGQSSASVVSKVYGFETKYLPYQDLDQRTVKVSLEEYLKLLADMQFTHYIVLNRRNYLRAAVSSQVARSNNTWHSKEKIQSPSKINFKTENIPNFGTKSSLNLLDLFEQKDVSFAGLKKNISGKILHLEFDDDIKDDPMVAYKKIIEFLDLPFEQPEIKLHRTNPFNYDQICENFGEVQALLKRTEYQWMLDD